MNLKIKPHILADAKPYKTITGIYFLIDGDEIVYVGQSIDVTGRVAHHWASGKVFDKYSYIEVPAEDLSRVEAEYIVTHWPKYNGDLLPCYDTWVTLNYLVRMFKGTKINRHKLKKYIENNGILDLNGFHPRKDFEDLIKEHGL